MKYNPDSIILYYSIAYNKGFLLKVLRKQYTDLFETRLESKVFSLERLCPNPKSLVFHFSIPLFPRDGVKWCG